jgi:hypothetical protein
MSSKINLALALLAGLGGGMLTRFIAPPAVAAQNQPQVAQEVRARSFVLVDAANSPLGTFTAERVMTGPMIGAPEYPPDSVPHVRSRIILRDAEGREVWSAGPDARIVPLGASR